MRSYYRIIQLIIHIQKTDTGCANSILIITDKDAPNTPANKANHRYKVPISLWFVEKNQRDSTLKRVMILLRALEY